MSHNFISTDIFTKINVSDFNQKKSFNDSFYTNNTLTTTLNSNLSAFFVVCNMSWIHKMG